MKSKIELKKLKVADAKRILELFANDNVLENLYGEKKAKDFTLLDEKKWLGKNVKYYGEEKPISFDLGIYVDGVLIGAIGAENIDWKNMNTEIGYWIGEEYWGNGYAVEAINKFVEILFEKFGLVRIWAPPFARNKASQRVLEKAGFVCEGTRRKAIKKGNEFFDDVMWVKVR